jgi:ATP-dependent DNA ligase
VSRTSGGKIILEGHEDQRLPGMSLYLTYVTDQSNKDLLFEFQGTVLGTSTDPRDYPDQKWDVFYSYGRILKEKKERNRKLLFPNVTAAEAIEKIRDKVLHDHKGYEAVFPPAWWTPIAKPEIEQVKPMLAQGVDLSHEREKLEATYDDDTYIAELKYDGHRAKAHFFFGDGSDPRVRFDSRRQSDKTGLFVENTGSLPHISRAALSFIQGMHGTILDGEVMHEEGLPSVGSIMGALPEKALRFQQEHGYATFMVFDCIRVKDTWIHTLPWVERRQYVDKIVALWQDAIDVSLRQHLKAVSFWEGTQAKRDIRKWALENGYEGLILKKKDSKYSLGSRSWAWVKDKKEARFSCIVMGFENSKSEKYGPKGWIEHIKLGQYRDGQLVEIGQVGTMEEQDRKWFSENRARALGMVVEVEAQEQIKGTHALRHPRFIAVRQDIKPDECVVGQKG